MRYFLSLLLLLVPFGALAQNDALSSVGQLTWQNRIILAWSNNPAPLKAALVRARTEIDERDIVWFVINDTQVETNYAGTLAPDFAPTTSHQFQSDSRQVLLIGKDGGIKNSDTELLLQSLFRDIDAMPMRQNEMRETRSSPKK